MNDATLKQIAAVKATVHTGSHIWRSSYDPPPTENMRLSIDGVCTKLLTLTKGQQPPYGLRCAPSAKGGSFARRGLPASATSTHRPLPLPETKVRRRSRQQHRRRAESGSNAACCPC